MKLRLIKLNAIFLLAANNHCLADHFALLIICCFYCPTAVCLLDCIQFPLLVNIRILFEFYLFLLNNNN